MFQKIRCINSVSFPCFMRFALKNLSIPKFMDTLGLMERFLKARETFFVQKNID